MGPRPQLGGDCFFNFMVALLTLDLSKVVGGGSSLGSVALSSFNSGVGLAF